MSWWNPEAFVRDWIAWDNAFSQSITDGVDEFFTGRRKQAALDELKQQQQQQRKYNAFVLNWDAAQSRANAGRMADAVRTNLVNYSDSATRGLSGGAVALAKAGNLQMGQDAGDLMAFNTSAQQMRDRTGAAWDEGDGLAGQLVSGAYQGLANRLKREGILASDYDASTFDAAALASLRAGGQATAVNEVAGDFDTMISSAQTIDAETRQIVSSTISEKDRPLIATAGMRMTSGTDMLAMSERLQSLEIQRRQMVNQSVTEIFNLIGAANMSDEASRFEGAMSKFENRMVDYQKQVARMDTAWRVAEFSYNVLEKAIQMIGTGGMSGGGTSNFAGGNSSRFSNGMGMA
jgi:hypothetical protein